MATPMTPPADEYDPLNPELSIPPEFLHDFFLVPDEAIVYNDYIDFLGNELDTADFEWGDSSGLQHLQTHQVEHRDRALPPTSRSG